MGCIILKKGYTMDLTIWALLGFMFAVYAVTANDSIQTLGTYISSNADVKWLSLIHI